MSLKGKRLPEKYKWRLLRAMSLLLGVANGREFYVHYRSGNPLYSAFDAAFGLLCLGLLIASVKF
jgi:hypothetical protein